MLDERVPLHRAAQPRHLQRPLPDADAGHLGAEALADFVEVTAFSTGTFPEPLAFSLRAWQHLRKPPRRLRPRPRQPEPRLRPARPSSAIGLPVLATIHHPITVDRRLEMEHAETALQALRRCAAGTRSPGCRPRVAQRLERVITVSENSFADIHRDHEVPVERMHVVPVGVDPELFRPIARRRARARPAHHHRQRRRHDEGPALPARGAGQAAHRARRPAPRRHRRARRRAARRRAPSSGSASPTSSSSCPA